MAPAKLSALSGLLLAHAVAAGIYPDGHFDVATKLTSQGQMDSLVQETIDKGNTLFVRWIASEG